MALRPIHAALGGVMRFGRLTVLREVDPKQFGDRRHRRVLAACDCGAETIVYVHSLKRGSTVSCGCRKAAFAGRLGEQSAKHSHARTNRVTSEYTTWQGMKARCYYPEHRYFSNYGGRGIEVCERWRESFEAFLADMGPKPSRSHTIDRIDNDRGYEPGNCRWATRKEQAANRR